MEKKEQDVVDDVEQSLDSASDLRLADSDAMGVLAEFDRDFDIVDAELDAIEEDKKIGDWEFIAELLNVFRMLNSSLRLEQVLEHVMDAAIAVTKAERGFIVLKGKNGDLEFKIARDAFKNHLSDKQFQISKSIVTRAIESRQGVYLNDVLEAEGFMPSESMAQLNLRSVVCSPLITENKVIGAIYADSGKPLIGKSRTKEQIFTSFADQAALAIRNSQLYQDLQNSYEQLTQAQDRLIYAERMATRGKIAARIGHEMNNLLAAMYGNLELTQRAISSGSNLDKIEDRLIKVMQMCEGMTRFTQGLMSSAHTSFNPILCDINDVVKDFLDFVHPIYKKTGAKFIQDLDADIPKLNIDIGQIQQVLYNAATNAVDARNDVTITVRTRHLVKDRKIVLTVTDNGPGILEEDLKKIFEPQFTTKPDGHGFGLGICKEIIRRHGGIIEMHSEYGKGAQLTVTLPIAENYE